MERILGIDVGDKRIGVAVTDPLQITAQGVMTLKRKTRDDDLEAFRDLIAKYEIKKVVAGLPLNMDGTRGIRVERTEAFAEELAKAFPDIPYHFWDERLTTVMAQKQLIAADVSRKKRKKVIDKMAAVAILEGYLQHLSLKNRG